MKSKIHMEAIHDLQKLIKSEIEVKKDRFMLKYSQR